MSKMISLKNIINKNKIVFNALLLAMLPLIMFTISLIYDGATLSSLRIPSLHNDELVYYYQVEGVLDYGMPQGLFGYGENYANMLSFGAWSPTLIINYCLLGKLFGWSPVRAVLYNVLMMMLALFIFGITAKPNKSQTVWLSIWYLTYTYTVTSILSVSPETTCYFYAIIGIGLCYGCFKNNNIYKIISLFLVGILLTSMRPYYVPFIVMAGYFLYKLHGKRTIPISSFIVLTGAYIYAFICENMCVQSPISGKFSTIVKEIHLNTDKSVLGNSPYLSSGFLLPFLKNFLHGLKIYLKQVYYFFDGSGQGRNFFLFSIILLALVLIGIHIILKIRKKDERILWIVFWVLYFVAMFFAICTMFINSAADRHLAEFVLMFIFIACMENNISWWQILFEILLVYSLMVAPNGHREYLPLDEIEKVYELKSEFEDKMPLTFSGRPTWDNTILWVYADFSTGEFRETPWQTMFSFPSGYAFNLFYMNKFLEQDTIRCRYIVTTPSGDTEKKCVDLGAKKIGECENFVLYQNY